MFLLLDFTVVYLTYHDVFFAPLRQSKGNPGFKKCIVSLQPIKSLDLVSLKKQKNVCLAKSTYPLMYSNNSCFFS